MKSEIMASEFISTLWEMCPVCVCACVRERERETVFRNCERDERWLRFVRFRRWIGT